MNPKPPEPKPECIPPNATSCTAKVQGVYCLSRNSRLSSWQPGKGSFAQPHPPQNSLPSRLNPKP